MSNEQFADLTSTITFWALLIIANIGFATGHPGYGVAMMILAAASRLPFWWKTLRNKPAL